MCDGEQADRGDVVDTLMFELLEFDEPLSSILLSLTPQSCSLPVSLRSVGPLTVFVPTNEALDLFQDGTVTYMITHVSDRCKPHLHHVWVLVKISYRNQKR